MCDDSGVDLYSLSDPSLETDQMVAVETRKPYTELPTAFRYRDAAEFKACDLKRYSQRVAELRARTVTPGNMENAIIPLPTQGRTWAQSRTFHRATAARGRRRPARQRRRPRLCR
ncbi:DUF2865 domain-containing protein [Mesorhizobium sp. MSK_1335]|uniref:DUF2865 domain-containing protein n=1 Tax=Mesorhizobium montanum TaxID=3072323 RepID=A0ABU4ZGT9_9HYPH|nr:DUF2865 domain-containing protein [Mesorhizobium sp. MSK_1335]MDX8523256.1 DUF2865 domain-containing protein [Mesorhizobium sp. MSK_1335]